MALPLLTMAAVPFLNCENNLAMRRKLRREIIPGSTPTNNQSGSLVNFDSIEPEKRCIIMGILGEAAKEIQSVIGLAPVQNLQDQLVQPPNSPNRENTRFDFSAIEINRFDGLEHIPACEDIQDATLSEESEKASGEMLKSMRKRKRIPSFKIGTPSRVQAKMSCPEFDSDSDDNDNDLRILKDDPDLYSNDDHEDLELKLKLDILAETRQIQAEGETDWAKVGADLRCIADSFSRSTNNDDDNGINQIDIISVLNTILPLSIPKSLWSAFISYAAWKFFAKFR